MKFIKHFLFTLYISLFLTTLISCRMLTGIKKPKLLTESEIVNLSNKMEIKGNLFFIDSSYRKEILSLKYQDVHAVKNHLQPVQALYYNQDGKLISYFINCYATPSLFNLKWNDELNFNTFPPKTQAPLDSMLSFDNLANFLKPISALRFKSSNKQKVVIFWSRMFSRYSKSLIKYVEANAKLYPELEIIYVNNDNYLNSIL